MSEQYLAVWFFFLFFLQWEYAQKPKFGEIQWKKNFIRHFARFNFSRLSLAYILKYYPILHVCDEKIIRLASKIRLKLNEKSASDF